MASSTGGGGNSAGGGSVPRRDTLILLGLFWAAVLAISLVRYGMQGVVPLGVMAPHIGAVTAFSALLCWFMAQRLEALEARSFGERVLWGVAGAAAMSVIQSIFHMASCRVAPIDGLAPMTVPEAVLAAVISFSYFAGWTGLHLALLYHRQGRRDPTLIIAAEQPHGTEAAEVGERSFWASRGRHVVRVRADDILWVEAQKDYVQLHAAGGGGMLRETLGSVQGKLDPALFIRVHRSAIVRRSEVAAIRRKPSGALSLRLTSGGEVPVGRSYARGLRDLIGRMEDAA